MKLPANTPALSSCLMALTLSSLASQGATLFGPIDITAALGTRTDITTLTSGQLNGQDALTISYGVTRSGGAASADTWAVLTLNDASDEQFAFNAAGGSDLSVLVRTEYTSPFFDHGLFGAAGTWTPNATSVDFDGNTPREHQVVLTIFNMGTGGFTGVKNFTLQIDHHASSFATADRTFTGTFNFGAADEGLELDLRSQLASHTFTDFTVSQIPEPSSVLLGGLGLLALLRRRR